MKLSETIPDPPAGIEPTTFQSLLWAQDSIQTNNWKVVGSIPVDWKNKLPLTK